MSVELFRCDLLFVHRDAERESALAAFTALEEELVRVLDSRRWR